MGCCPVKKHGSILVQKTRCSQLITTFKDPANATKFVNACYSEFISWGNHGFSWVGVSSITSDDADKGSDPGDLGSDKDQLDNFSYSPTTGSVEDVWNTNLEGIGRCAQAIENVPKFSIDNTLKERLIGEAKFLRAHFYFTLVRSFGDVPLITRVLNTPEEIAAANIRSPKADVYAFIIADLTDAIAKLPVKSTYSGADIGRATKGAAQGYLAKVNLYMKNWSQSKAMADAVINSGEYTLATNYATLWRMSSENGSESLFEIQCQNGQEGWTIPAYFVFQGARGTVTGGWGGWGFNSPTLDLDTSYEAGDLRKAATIYKKGQTLWDGAVIGNDVANLRYNYKAYASQTLETNYSDWNSNKNVRLLRLGEIYLIKAEAENELGNTGAAITALNLIRTRAGLPNTTATSQSDVRNAIWKERRFELAMEEDRFFDLVRQGRAGIVMRAHGKTFVDGKHEVFPVPFNAIQTSQGTLTQNPGY